jgi:hypothetical protein
MILVPYICNTTNPNWIQLAIFLRTGGREMWSVDNPDEIADILSENGFPVEVTVRGSDITYAKVRQDEIRMSDFYKWDEIDPSVSEQDVWRFFKIPRALWECDVFRENYIRETGLPMFGQIMDNVILV